MNIDPMCDNFRAGFESGVVATLFAIFMILFIGRWIKGGES